MQFSLQIIVKYLMCKGDSQRPEFLEFWICLHFCLVLEFFLKNRLSRLVIWQIAHFSNSCPVWVELVRFPGPLGDGSVFF